MRLFLLPISTRQSLLYCAKAVEQLPPGAKPMATDKTGKKVAAQWASWEKKPSGFQKQVTVYCGKLLQRIPYQEWALKSLPPATAKQLQTLESEQPRLECLYPSQLLDTTSVKTSLQQLAVERQSFHRKRMWQTAFTAPFMLPFAFVPMLNKLVLGYLAFRTWSHYRAFYGGVYLEALLSRHLITPASSKKMDEIYSNSLPHLDSGRHLFGTVNDKREAMVLNKPDGKLIAQAFKLPEMEVEITRAIEQVESIVNSPAKGEKEKVDGKMATLSPRVEKS